MSKWERIEAGFYRYRPSGNEPADVLKIGPRKWEANYRPRNGIRTSKYFGTAAEAKLHIELTLR
ncbi:hypothetical protein [Streptomyces pseudogriseolus]|uniref:hypothetical protein n=1 Tax=Streptomyces pseudogriseolus TaxID=36817 RepID=UPI003FA207AF